MDFIVGPGGATRKIPDLTDPEKRVSYSTDWFMVHVRQKSTREELQPVTLQAPSFDVAYKAVKRWFENVQWRNLDGSVIPSGDLEIFHIKRRAPRRWSRWEVGLKDRWV